ncbi:hypothetical protein SVAN01_10396 [Stagonosporopsis vannaccii]|nr:hypothetical protein SVAN01_10396 [Stagonosporopsis vannaccii]
MDAARRSCKLLQLHAAKAGYCGSARPVRRRWDGCNGHLDAASTRIDLHREMSLCSHAVLLTALQGELRLRSDRTAAQARHEISAVIARRESGGCCTLLASQRACTAEGAPIGSGGEWAWCLDRPRPAISSRPQPTFPSCSPASIHLKPKPPPGGTGPQGHRRYIHGGALQSCAARHRHRCDTAFLVC